MNAIETQNRIDFYVDNTRGARYERIEYDNAVNDAIKKFITSITDDIGFQRSQSVSDKLYSLQKTQSAAPSSDVALYPNDYLSLTSLFITISSVEVYCRPTTQNKLGPLLNDTYRKPTDKKPYYIQTSTGFKLYHGSGTITQAKLDYIKKPAIFTIGKKSQLLHSTDILVNASVYVCTEPTTYAGSTYNIGSTFTASGTTTITEGEVMLLSATTSIELPESTHEQIAKMAAEIMSGNTQDYNKSQFIEKEASQS